MDWFTCSKTFIRVVENMQISKAAAQLNASVSVVSKRISWLEDMLKVQLLYRTTRHIEVTKAGTLYYKRIIPLFREWEQIKSDVSILTELAEYQLRISMPTLTANSYIDSLLENFTELHPDIKIQLIFGNCTNELIKNHTDLEITTTNDCFSCNSNLVTKRLRGPTRRLYASPEYIAKHGEPKSLHDLNHHNCITHVKHRNNYWTFQQDNLQVSGNFSCNSSEGMIKAAISGRGIVFFADSFLDDELKSKKLQLILPEYYSKPIDIYISYSTNKQLPQKSLLLIQSIKDYLTNQFVAIDKSTPKTVLASGV